MILAYPKGVHAGAASWGQSLRFPAPFNLTRIFSGAVTSSPCLECSISIDVVAEQPFDLGQPAQEYALTFALETQYSTHDTLASAHDPRSTPRPPPARLAGGAWDDRGFFGAGAMRDEKCPEATPRVSLGGDRTFLLHRLDCFLGVAWLGVWSCCTQRRDKASNSSGSSPARYR